MDNNISFIVPAYNAEKYIIECITSILNILAPNDEILIINDGSTDDTLKKINVLASRDKRITIINQKNQGVSVARNNGILKAKNSYISFVDADDLIGNRFKKIERLYNGADIIYYATNIDKNINKSDLLLHLACVHAPKIPAPFSKVFKKDFLIKQKILFPEKIINGEDMLFNLEALLAAKNYKIINESYYKYRVMNGTATKRFDEKIIESDRIFHKRMNLILSTKNKNYEKSFNLIKTHNRNHAIITILKRISYIDSYKKARVYYNFLNKKPYSDILTKPHGIKQKIIFKLCLSNNYWLLYRLFKLKQKNDIKQEYFKEI